MEVLEGILYPFDQICLREGGIPIKCYIESVYSLSTL